MRVIPQESKESDQRQMAPFAIHGLEILHGPRYDDADKIAAAQHQMINKANLVLPSSRSQTSINEMVVTKFGHRMVPSNAE